MVSATVVNRGCKRAALAALLALGLGLPVIPTASATGLTVNTTADELNSDGDCSLREAIRAANLNAPVDACPAGGANDTLTLPAGAFTLTLGGADDDAAAGDLDLSGSLKLVGAGPGATTIDANHIDRAFDVQAGANVTISNLTIKNGSAGEGGGVRNAGTLTLTNVTVRDSSANQGCATPGCVEPTGGFGGGVYNTGTLSLTGKTLVTHNAVAGCCFTALSGPNYGGGVFNSGSLLMNNATISFNRIDNISGPTSTSGGGLYNAGQAQISNSTINNNFIDQCCGGGIYNGGTLKMTNATISANNAWGGHGGGLLNEGTAILNNVTVAFNLADLDHRCDPQCVGGGISNYGSVYLTNSILAENAGGTPDCSGAIVSQGHNLIQRRNGCAISGNQNGNVYNLSPKLGPLENNGPTWTHYPRTGSPTIDAGNAGAPGSGGNACPAHDQRGTVRPVDGNGDGVARCDIGAVEHH